VDFCAEAGEDSAAAVSIRNRPREKLKINAIAAKAKDIDARSV